MKFSHLVEINVGLFVRADAWDGWKESERCMKPAKIKPPLPRMYSFLSLFFFSPSSPFLSFLFSLFIFFFFCSTTVRRSLALVCYADFSSTDVKGLKVFAAGNNKLCRASGNSWRGHRAKLSRRSSPGILCSTMLLPLSDSINERWFRVWEPVGFDG